MAESDDDYETRMLRDTIPRGLRSDYGAPPRERIPPPRDHLLGSTGEGRDKDVVPSKAPTDPNISGAPDDGVSNSPNKTVIVIDDDMVARYYKIYAVLVGDVP